MEIKTQIKRYVNCYNTKNAASIRQKAGSGECHHLGVRDGGDGRVHPTSLRVQAEPDDPALAVGAPTGSIFGVRDSGWITEELFLSWLQHFQQAINARPDNPVLLISDNHCTHITLNAWNFIKENGIFFVTIPPHTIHRLQTLDVTFFKPLKTNYEQAIKSWEIGHPGERVTTSTWMPWNNCFVSVVSVLVWVRWRKVDSGRLKGSMR